MHLTHLTPKLLMGRGHVHNVILNIQPLNDHPDVLFQHQCVNKYHTSLLHARVYAVLHGSNSLIEVQHVHMWLITYAYPLVRSQPNTEAHSPSWHTIAWLSAAGRACLHVSLGYPKLYCTALSMSRAPAPGRQVTHCTHHQQPDTCKVYQLVCKISACGQDRTHLCIVPCNQVSH